MNGIRVLGWRRSARVLSLPLGIGNRTLTAATWFPTGSGPVSAAVGDVTSDGAPDIVTANGFSDEFGHDMAVLIQLPEPDTATSRLAAMVVLIALARARRRI